MSDLRSPAVSGMTHLLACQAPRNQCAVDMRRRPTQETAADEVEILLTGGRISIINTMNALAVTPTVYLLNGRQHSDLKGRWMAAILSASESAHVHLDRTESNLNLFGKKITGPIGMLEEKWSKATDRMYPWQRHEAAVRQLASLHECCSQQPAGDIYPSMETPELAAFWLLVPDWLSVLHMALTKHYLDPMFLNLTPTNRGSRHAHLKAISYIQLGEKRGWSKRELLGFQICHFRPRSSRCYHSVLLVLVEFCWTTLNQIIVLFFLFCFF